MKKNEEDKTFSILAGNITSLSPKAKGSLFNKTTFNKYSAILATEVHTTEHNVNKVFSNHGWNARYNSPLNLPSGRNHGGEVVAVKSNLD